MSKRCDSSTGMACCDAVACDMRSPALYAPQHCFMCVEFSVAQAAINFCFVIAQKATRCHLLKQIKGLENDVIITNKDIGFKPHSLQSPAALS
jgi:hypothetical protein